jgi:hypothetical protein
VQSVRPKEILRDSIGACRTYLAVTNIGYRRSAEVKVSEILKFYREDFLRTSPDLTAYINRHLGAKMPEGYKVDFIDYDWTVNNSRM